MNRDLTEQIAYHIFASLGVLPASFINSDNLKSLNDNQFIIKEKFVFEGENISHNIYVCEIKTTDSIELKIMLGDCTQDEKVPEFCLLVHLKDSPAYGLYLVFNKLSDDPPEAEAMIAVNMDKGWMLCDTYLQATFLAGMERIKDLGRNWTKCLDYKDQHKLLISFIKFHDDFFGEINEG